MIVILGVLGVMGVNFISQAFQGFKDTSDRSEIYEEGKLALVRMEKEIHNAIPNAVDRPSATELQFGLIDEVAMRNVFGMYDENPPTQTLSDLFILPPTSDTTKFLPAGSIISIYNRNWNDFTAAPLRLYQVTNVAPLTGVMDISKKVAPSRSSPLKRYYAVDQAIRYKLTGTTLERAEATVDATGVGAFGPNYPLAQDVTNLTFSYAPAALNRNALVTINFTITKGSEAINFHKEFHIRNVP